MANVKLSPSPESEDIRQLFDRLAPRYDFFNRLTSLGLDQFWRRELVKEIPRGARVLDLGCGTGDLSFAAARRAGPEGEVIGIDFSEAMLRKASRRQKRSVSPGQAPVRFLRQRAEALSEAAGPFDWVISAFVLRNIHQNITLILQKMYAVTTPGGAVSFLDITEPQDPLWRRVWQFYMGSVVALYGRALFGEDYPRSYITDSANRFPKEAEFCRQLKQAGYQKISAKKYLGGIIIRYRGTKAGP